MTNLNVTATAGDAPDAAELETSAAGDAVVNVDMETVETLRQSLTEQDAAEAAPASGDATADTEAGNDNGDEADGDRNATAGIDEAVTGDGENAVAEAGDDAPVAGTHAPGLVQVGRISRRAAGDAAARAEKLKAIQQRADASELRDAKAAVAAAGVSLTPAEVRDLRDIAEGEDDLRELREEKLEEKRQQAAMR